MLPRGRPGITPRVKKSQKKPKEPISNKKGGGALLGPGPGRPKGSRNKFSGELKALVLEALANAQKGGDAVDYLIAQAQLPNPSAFMSLIGKCITQATESKLDETVEVKVSFID